MRTGGCCGSFVRGMVLYIVCMPPRSLALLILPFPRPLLPLPLPWSVVPMVPLACSCFTTLRLFAGGGGVECMEQ